MTVANLTELNDILCEFGKLTATCFGIVIMLSITTVAILLVGRFCLHIIRGKEIL